MMEISTVNSIARCFHVTGAVEAVQILALQELCGLGLAQSQSPGFVSHLKIRALLPLPWVVGVKVH